MVSPSKLRRKALRAALFGHASSSTTPASSSAVTLPASTTLSNPVILPPATIPTQDDTSEATEDDENEDEGDDEDENQGNLEDEGEDQEEDQDGDEDEDEDEAAVVPPAPATQPVIVVPVPRPATLVNRTTRPPALRRRAALRRQRASGFTDSMVAPIFRPPRPAAGQRRARGELVADEIRHYQLTGGFLIRRRPFQRLVRELVFDFQHGHWGGAGEPMRIQAGALLALQTAAEQVLVRYFEVLSRFAGHGQRMTINRRDQDLFRAVCSMISEGSNPFARTS